MSKKQKQPVEQETVRSLKQKIKLLKRLPKDFRDIDPGSSAWEAFAKVTNRRKEMEKWAAGPVLCFGEPNEAEKMILSTIRHFAGGLTFCKADWFILLSACENDKIVWIYLPDETPEVVTALNVLLSRFEYNCRVRGQILSERSGKPIGIVH